MKWLFTIALPILCLYACIDDSPRSIQYAEGGYWMDNFRNNSFPAKAFRDDKIYCSTIEIGSGIPNYFYCLDLTTGKVDWRAMVESWAAIPPIIADSFIYYCSYLGDIYKFDKNGHPLWKTKLNGSYSGHSLNTYNNNLFVCTVEDGVYEYDACSGAIVYHYGANTLGATIPLCMEEYLFIGGLRADTSHPANRYLYCFDIKTRAKRWQKYTGEIEAKPFANNDQLYYLGNSSILHCINPVDGSAIWQSTELPIAAFTPQLVFEDSTIFYYSTNLNEMLELSNPGGRVRRQSSYSEFRKNGRMKSQLKEYLITANNNNYTLTVSNEKEVPISDTQWNITVHRGND